jgi:hypothetical protein
MRIGALFLGMMAWTAAVVVPGWYVTAMAKAAVRETGYSYSLDNLLGKFTSMPWPLWVYAIAMTLLGTLLVIWALHRMRSQRSSDEMSV